MTEEATRVEFENKPLDGYVRIVSYTEAKTVGEKGFFLSGEFFEVRDSRLPPDVYYHLSQEKRGQEPYKYSRALFIPSGIASQLGLSPRIKHSDYGQDFPGINFGRPPQGEILKTGAQDITAEVEATIRSQFPNKKEITIEESTVLAVQPFFTLSSRSET